MATARSQALYDVHPGVAMVQKWVGELKSKTGRTLEEWIALVKKEGPKDEKTRREWLKTKHKLGTNSAWWIAERAEGKGGEEDTGRISDGGSSLRGKAILRTQGEVTAGLRRTSEEWE